MGHTYYVYIMSSLSRCLYTGVTRDIIRRVGQHRQHSRPGAFTRQYNTRRLVHVEATGSIHTAITREKELKRWNRAKKLELIERTNPGWRDLAARWPDIEMPG